jgi:tRNA A-37 threonylcarbamoyl transferase component Bud32
VLVEDESLKLLSPPPGERLMGWLHEFYGKDVEVKERIVLRHRDLSLVERLQVRDALPESLIYKVVLPPWDVEQDLHERILIPSISNSARLFLSGTCGPMTALFMEDLGTQSLVGGTDPKTAHLIGTELAKMHRAYEYRTEELSPLGILRTLRPGKYFQLVENLLSSVSEWQLCDEKEQSRLRTLGRLLDEQLSSERPSLVHGDLYAENIILRGGRFYIIDWSWFTMIGIPILDLATLVCDHFKNGEDKQWQQVALESYLDEAGRDGAEVKRLLPFAYTLSRLLFLDWLVERRSRGIMGTTKGPVDGVIQSLIRELVQRTDSLENNN